MSELIEVKVPDIGDYADVPVIELFVKPGDTIRLEDPIATLESDKATMDVPSTAAGVVREVLVQVGDRVAEGKVLIKIEAAGAETAAAPDAAGNAAAQATPANSGAALEQSQASAPSDAGVSPAAASAPAPAPAPVPTATGRSAEVRVPDIGDFSDVPVIELFVKVGDTIKLEDSIATLESDKATMDVPSSAAGVVREVKVKVGDRVSEGAVLIVVDSAAGAASASASASAPAPAPAPAATPVAAPAAARIAAADATPADAPEAFEQSKLSAPALAQAGAPSAVALGGKVHASPSVRAYARELGVDLAQVRASGPKGRIVREDVTAFVKGAMQSGVVPGKAAAAGAGVSLGGGLDLLPWPKVDFSKFGEIESTPLSRIKKISGQNLARNWVMIPAVTYHEDADITDLEAFRVAVNKENEKSGKKLTMLAFIIKASVRALQQFPEFNTSLDASGGELSLVYKKYFNIAFAADTPNGLVVPVIKNADRKSVFEIAAESGELAKKARDGKLGPADMSGACFTISSLGGIGGTYFAPIVNAPEVAILGVNKSVMKPVWDGKEFVPRLTLPMSLTADHRVIDGALATRFNVYLAQLLSDFRRVML